MEIKARDSSNLYLDFSHKYGIGYVMNNKFYGLYFKYLCI